jgi:ABC-type dipeptide/oligopeptide/nickel transport system permease component
VAVTIPLLFGLVVVSFFLVRIGDANPAVLIAGPQASTAEIEMIESDLGLDQPLSSQFVTYLRSLAEGDLGDSWASGRSVTSEIRNRLPASLELIVFGLLGALVVGSLLGALPDQLKKGSLSHLVAERNVDIGTVLVMAVPIFWAALLLLYVFWFQLNIFPPPIGRLPLGVAAPPDITGSYVVDAMLSRDWEVFGAALRQMALPIITLIISESVVIARHVRAVTREIRNSPYYRYARALGSSNASLVALVLRNAAPSIIGFFGIVFAASLGGVALIELVFSWGGIGDAGLKAMQRADFAMVQGFILVSGVFVTLVYLVTDSVATLLDPRALE